MSVFRTLIAVAALSLSLLPPARSQAADPTPADPFAAPEFNKPFVNPTDDPKLPRVLIIGDSISIGYTTTVRRELYGKANVHRNPGNAAYSANGVRYVKSWVEGGKWDVIHFNFGLWDWYGWSQPVRATPESYAANLEAIVKELKATGAIVIFATTTPPCVGPEHKIKVQVSEDEAKAYNDAAVAVMKKNGILIDDLYGCISADRAKYSKGVEDVHWNDDGSQLLGKQVAAEITKQLK